MKTEKKKKRHSHIVPFSLLELLHKPKVKQKSTVKFKAGCYRFNPAVPELNQQGASGLCPVKFRTGAFILPRNFI